MEARDPSLTVVLLAYNEAANVADAIGEHARFLEGALDDWEIVVVDDGSTDETADRAAHRAGADPRIRVERHERNCGMGAGIATGIRAATKSHFVMNAADGQIAAAEIGALLGGLDEADIVLTTYADRRRERGWGRDALSRGLRRYLSLVAHIRFELEGLYLFPVDAAKRLEPKIHSSTFFYSFELVQRGIELGLTTTSREIRVRPRAAGRSKVLRLGRIGRVARDALAYRVSRHGERA